MMAALTMADFFDGVAENEYTNPVGVAVNGGVRELCISKVKEQTFTFRGVPSHLAWTSSQITVTDAKSTSSETARTYTFTPQNSFTDGSRGTLIIEKESVTVSRTPISPRLFDVVVRRRGAKTTANGAVIVAAPAWTGY